MKMVNAGNSARPVAGVWVKVQARGTNCGEAQWLEAGARTTGGRGPKGRWARAGAGRGGGKIKEHPPPRKKGAGGWGWGGWWAREEMDELWKGGRELLARKSVTSVVTCR